MMDLFISEKEVKIDLKSLDEFEEDSFFSTLLRPVKLENKVSDTLFVAVKAYKEELVKDFPNFEICGKSLLDHILSAGEICEEIQLEDGDIFDKLKEIDTDKKIFAVFYCDTPLVDKKTFLKILEYFSEKNLDYLELSRGFIIKKNCLKNEVALRSAFQFEDPNLFVVENAKGLNYACKVIQERIRQKHINKGVIIFGDQSVFIDDDVEIESGVIIYPNNILKGKTVIEKNVTLKEGNFIKDSLISQGAILSHCFVDNSKINGEHKNEKIEKEEN